MHFQKVGWEGMEWIDLAQDRGRWRAPVKAVMDLRVPYNAGSLLTSWVNVSFSQRTLFHGVIHTHTHTHTHTLGISMVPEDGYKVLWKHFGHFYEYPQVEFFVQFVGNKLLYVKLQIDDACFSSTLRMKAKYSAETSVRITVLFWKNTEVADCYGKWYFSNYTASHPRKP